MSSMDKHTSRVEIWWYLHHCKFVTIHRLWKSHISGDTSPRDTYHTSNEHKFNMLKEIRWIVASQGRSRRVIYKRSEEYLRKCKHSNFSP